VLRPILHNQHLPNWLQRLVNGIVSGLVVLALAAFVDGPPWSLWLAVPIGLAFMMPDPNRFSLVEGCAGEAGYDELDDD
jgi:hypothetical protein